MDGRSSGLGGVARAGGFPVAEAVLLVLTVAVLAASTDGGASEQPLALSLVPFLFALVVLAHRATGAWAAVRERRWPPDSAREALVGLWGAVEVVSAVGFLLLAAAFVGGLLTAATTLSGEALSLSIRSAFGAAAALILLVVAVAARLAATALVRVGSRVAATRSRGGGALTGPGAGRVRC